MSTWKNRNHAGKQIRDHLAGEAHREVRRVWSDLDFDDPAESGPRRLAVRAFTGKLTGEAPSSRRIAAIMYGKFTDASGNCCRTRKLKSTNQARPTVAVTSELLGE